MANDVRTDYTIPRAEVYENLFYEYTIIYTIMGIILSLISGIGMIFNGYILYKKIKKESKK